MTTKTMNDVAVPKQWVADFYSPALIIDDDDVIQSILISQLNQIGLQGTESSTNGEQARICLASRVRIGLIILDLSMPQLDGVALIKDIARYQPNATLIVLSSQDKGMLRAAGLLAESYGLKVLGTLEKPLKKQVLYGILAMGLGSSKVDTEKNSSIEFLPTKTEILNSLSDLCMYFQPKVSLATGEVVGCEALARMNIEIGGVKRLLTADYFIPYFEVEGRISELSDRVIEKSLDSLVMFHKSGLDISISINLSMQDLERPSLTGFIHEQIRKRSLRPDKITFEITETSFSQNLSACIETVSRLRLLGVSVSIDDFGTGFSSLKQLREFPFNELKIDRSFVNGALSDPGAKAIVAACIGIATAFGMHTVAEGIETLEEKELLSNLGCNIGQGYLFAKPLSQTDFFAWFQATLQKK